jgi:hypothetical protein
MIYLIIQILFTNLSLKSKDLRISNPKHINQDRAVFLYFEQIKFLTKKIYSSYDICKKKIKGHARLLEIKNIYL